MSRADIPDAEGSLYVNADWSALVPAGSAEARFGITPEDARARGLLPLPEVKQAPAPANKQARKPPNK